MSLPRILEDHLLSAGIPVELTERSLLEEAEWQADVYLIYENLEADGYTEADYRELRQYIRRQRANGVAPLHWEDESQGDRPW